MRIFPIGRITVAVALLAAAAACANTPDSQPTDGAAAGTEARPAITIDRHNPDAAKFYNRFHLAGALHSEFYASLAQGVPAANAVIIGEVVEVRQTRQVGTEANPFLMIGVVLRPVEVVAGELPQKFADKLTVEFIGPTVDPTGKSDPVGDLQKILPTGHQGLWLLRSKTERVIPGKPATLPPANPVEQDYWRVVSPQGLFVQGRDGVETPLAEEIGGDMAAEGRRYGRMSDLISYVERAS